MGFGAFLCVACTDAAEGQTARTQAQGTVLCLC
uniref:Uncharacterized protein n=1 Tax=Anguilla anguilla TaxID=7936 RepID=A0A0E9SQJ2_ANGAN